MPSTQSTQMEDKGTLTPEIASRALAPFVFDFGTQALGDKPAQLLIEFSNATPLPVSWELHRYACGFA